MAEAKAFVFDPKITNTSKRIFEKLLLSGTKMLFLMPQRGISDAEKHDINVIADHYKAIYPETEFCVIDIENRQEQSALDKISCLEIYFDVPQFAFSCRNEERISRLASKVRGHLVATNGLILPPMQMFGEDLVYEDRDEFRIHEEVPYVNECDLCPKEILEETVEKDVYTPILKKLLKSARYEHSKSTAESAYKLAVRFRGNNEATWTDSEFASATYVAGLLHDCSKDLDKNYQKNIFNLMDTPFILPSFAWHQFVSMYLAEKLFGINNVQLLSGIGFHCTGCASMTPLEIYVYMADKMEPKRDYKTDIYWDLLDEGWMPAFVKVLEDQRSYLASKGVDPETNELTSSMYDCYLGEKRYA